MATKSRAQQRTEDRFCALEARVRNAEARVDALTEEVSFLDEIIAGGMEAVMGKSRPTARLRAIYDEIARAVG